MLAHSDWPSHRALVAYGRRTGRLDRSCPLRLSGSLRAALPSGANDAFAARPCPLHLRGAGSARGGRRSRRLRGELIAEDQTLLARLLARYPAYIGTHLSSLYRQHPQSTSPRAERAGGYHGLRAHPARAAFLDWLGGDVASSACPSTMRALLIARTMLTGNSTPLRLTDPPRYALVVIRKGSRRTATRFRALTRRLQGRRPSLPPATQ